MRRPILAGNWKMYKTAPETTEFIERFKPLVSKIDGCEIVVFPAAINIPAAIAAVGDSSVGIGGQNIYWGKEGAFTGEISADMLRAAGAGWVLVGHSERRNTVCHETDADVLKKTQAALAADLKPVVCVGERLEEHKAGGALPSSVRRADVDEVRRTELVEEAWAEASQTDEVKRNLEILKPVIERVGF